MDLRSKSLNVILYLEVTRVAKKVEKNHGEEEKKVLKERGIVERKRALSREKWGVL